MHLSESKAHADALSYLTDVPVSLSPLTATHLHLACSPQSRTFAIETSMKSSAFGFLLAKLHFADFLVRVPAAV